MLFRTLHNKRASSAPAKRRSEETQRERPFTYQWETARIDGDRWECRWRKNYNSKEGLRERGQTFNTTTNDCNYEPRWNESKPKAAAPQIATAAWDEGTLMGCQKSELMPD